MEIILLLHNIRSIHNVGSILRTAEGFGAKKIFFSGYTPYPLLKNDTRLPHISHKIDKTIHKTALGAEKILDCYYSKEPKDIIAKFPNHLILALEQAPNSQNLYDFELKKSAILILGEEVNGIDSHLLSQADVILEIPMVGQKESFNVSVATGICLYQLTKNI